MNFISTVCLHMISIISLCSSICTETLHNDELNRKMSEVQILINPPAPDPIRSPQDQGATFFSCQSTGKFQNLENSNTYWNCDVSRDGGFVAIQRNCPMGHTFSSSTRSCVPKCEPQCNDEKKQDEKQSYIVIVTEENEPEITTSLTPDTTTSCTTKYSTKTTFKHKTTTKHCIRNTTTQQSFQCNSEGAFPDPDNCESFYLCHQKRDAQKSYETIKIKCPEGMAFDNKLGWCSRQAAAACKTTDKPFGLTDLINLLRKEINTRSNQNEDRFVEKRDASVAIHPKNTENLQVVREQKSFECPTKGRFPDPENRNKYYICYPKGIGEGYLTLKMKCPGNTQFDGNSCSSSM